VRMSREPGHRGANMREGWEWARTLRRVPHERRLWNYRGRVEFVSCRWRRGTWRRRRVRQPLFERLVRVDGLAIQCVVRIHDDRYNIKRFVELNDCCIQQLGWRLVRDVRRAKPSLLQRWGLHSGVCLYWRAVCRTTYRLRIRRRIVLPSRLLEHSTTLLGRPISDAVRVHRGSDVLPSMRCNGRTTLQQRPSLHRLSLESNYVRDGGLVHLLWYSGR